MSANDHSYSRFTRPQRVATAISTLNGILRGIALDGEISPAECRELMSWCREKQDLLAHHPFTELLPLVVAAVSDGRIDPEEQADILWMCDNLSGGLYYDQRTSEIQVLHGMLHGILSDGVITDAEAAALADWSLENEHLKGTYPFDELDSVLTSALADGRIDAEEQETLKAFFEDFITYSMARRMADMRTGPLQKQQLKLPGVCAVAPELTFTGRIFCFTGTSTKAPREVMVAAVKDRGGIHAGTVRSDLNYLIVGAGGNPCWAFSCYGRKVETAMDLRRNRHPLLIVHESDFWDALA